MSEKISKQIINETIEPAKEETISRDIITPSTTEINETLDVAKDKAAAVGLINNEFVDPVSVATPEENRTDEEIISEAVKDKYVSPPETGVEVAGLGGLAGDILTKTKSDPRLDRELGGETMESLDQDFFIKGRKIYAAQASQDEINLLNAAIYGNWDAVTKKNYFETLPPSERERLNKTKKYVPEVDENGLLDIRTKDDIQRFIYEFRESYKDQLKATGGNKKSFESVLKSALELDNNAVLRKLFKLGPDETLKRTDEVVLANIMNLNSLFRLRDMAKTVKDGGQLKGKNGKLLSVDQSYMVFAQALTVHKALNAAVTGNNTVLARNLSFLQSIGKYFESNPYTQGPGIDALQNLGDVDKLMINYNLKKDAMTGLQNGEDFRLLATRFLELDNAAKQNRFLNGMGDSPNFLQKGWRYVVDGTGKSLDVLTEAYAASVLFSTDLFMLNNIGNMIPLINRIPEVTISTAYGKIRKAFNKNGEAPNPIDRGLYEGLGMVHSMKEAVKTMGHVWWNEKPLDDSIRYDTRKHKATALPEGDFKETTLGKGIDYWGKAVRLSLRTNMAIDELYKTVNERAFLYGEATLKRDEFLRQGLSPEEADRKTLEFINNPDDETVVAMKARARENTYTKRINFPSPKITRHPAFKLMVSLFYNTPVNVVDYTTQRIPGLNFLNPNFYKALNAGGRQADEAFAKFTWGGVQLTVLTQYSMGLMDKGVYITTSRPGDPEERYLWEDRGYKPNHVYFQDEDGSWKGRSYAGAEPASDVFATAALIGSMTRSGNNSDAWTESMGDLVLGMTAANLNYLGDFPGMQNIGYLVDIMSSYRENGIDSSLDKIAEYFSYVAGDTVLVGGSQLVLPNVMSLGLMNKLSLITDPAQRSRLPEEISTNPVIVGLTKAYRRYENLNPYIGSKASQEVNFWYDGKTKRAEAEGFGQSLLIMTPWYIKEPKYNDINVFTDDFLNGTGFSTPPRISKGGASVKLNDDEYTEFVRLYNTIEINGLLMKDRLLNLIHGGNADYARLYYKYNKNTGKYEETKPKEKRNILLGEIGNYKEKAKEILFRNNPSLSKRVNDRIAKLENLEN